MSETTSIATTAVSNEIAQTADGMFAKAKNAVNGFIKAAPDVFARFSKKLENVSNMDDEEAAQALEDFYKESADKMNSYAETMKSIPGYANSFDVKNLETLKNAFDSLATEVKEAKTASSKIKKAIKLVGTLLFIIGKKILEVGVMIAKKMLVVGIRIAVIVGGYVITLITKAAKLAKKAIGFYREAIGTSKNDVYDLSEDEYTVLC